MSKFSKSKKDKLINVKFVLNLLIKANQHIITTISAEHLRYNRLKNLLYQMKKEKIELYIKLICGDVKKITWNNLLDNNIFLSNKLEDLYDSLNEDFKYLAPKKENMIIEEEESIRKKEKRIDNKKTENAKNICVTLTNDSIFDAEFIKHLIKDTTKEEINEIKDVLEEFEIRNIADLFKIKEIFTKANIITKSKEQYKGEEHISLEMLINRMEDKQKDILINNAAKIMENYTKWINEIFDEEMKIKITFKKLFNVIADQKYAKFDHFLDNTVEKIDIERKIKEKEKMNNLFAKLDELRAKRIKRVEKLRFLGVKRDIEKENKIENVNKKVSVENNGEKNAIEVPKKEDMLDMPPNLNLSENKLKENYSFYKDMNNNNINLNLNSNFVTEYLNEKNMDKWKTAYDKIEEKNDKKKIKSLIIQQQEMKYSLKDKNITINNLKENYDILEIKHRNELKEKNKIIDKLVEKNYYSTEKRSKRKLIKDKSNFEEDLMNPKKREDRSQPRVNIAVETLARITISDKYIILNNSYKPPKDVLDNIDIKYAFNKQYENTEELRNILKKRNEEIKTVNKIKSVQVDKIMRLPSDKYRLNIFKRNGLRCDINDINYKEYKIIENEMDKVGTLKRTKIKWIGLKNIKIDEKELYEYDIIISRKLIIELKEKDFKKIMVGSDDACIIYVYIKKIYCEKNKIIIMDKNFKFIRLFDKMCMYRYIDESWNINDKKINNNILGIAKNSWRLEEDTKSKNKNASLKLVISDLIENDNVLLMKEEKNKEKAPVVKSKIENKKVIWYLDEENEDRTWIIGQDKSNKEYNKEIMKNESMKKLILSLALSLKYNNKVDLNEINFKVILEYLYKKDMWKYDSEVQKIFFNLRKSKENIIKDKFNYSMWFQFIPKANLAFLKAIKAFDEVCKFNKMNKRMIKNGNIYDMAITTRQMKIKLENALTNKWFDTSNTFINEDVTTNNFSIKSSLMIRCMISAVKNIINEMCYYNKIKENDEIKKFNTEEVIQVTFRNIGLNDPINVIKTLSKLRKNNIIDRAKIQLIINDKDENIRNNIMNTIMITNLNKCKNLSNTINKINEIINKESLSDEDNNDKEDEKVLEDVWRELDILIKECKDVNNGREEEKLDKKEKNNSNKFVKKSKVLDDCFDIIKNIMKWSLINTDDSMIKFITEQAIIFYITYCLCYGIERICLRLKNNDIFIYINKINKNINKNKLIMNIINNIKALLSGEMIINNYKINNNKNIYEEIKNEEENSMNEMIKKGWIMLKRNQEEYLPKKFIIEVMSQTMIQKNIDEVINTERKEDFYKSICYFIRNWYPIDKYQDESIKLDERDIILDANEIARIIWDKIDLFTDNMLQLDMININKNKKDIIKENIGSSRGSSSIINEKENSEEEISLRKKEIRKKEIIVNNDNRVSYNVEENERKFKRLQNAKLLKMITEKRIPRNQFVELEVGTDGNCFFRSWARLLDMNEDDYNVVKQMIVDYIEPRKKEIIESIGEQAWKDFCYIKDQPFAEAQGFMAYYSMEIFRKNLIIFEPCENPGYYGVNWNFNLIDPSLETVIMVYCNCGNELSVKAVKNHYKPVFWTGDDKEVSKEQLELIDKNYNEYKEEWNILRSEMFDSHDMTNKTKLMMNLHKRFIEKWNMKKEN